MLNKKAQSILEYAVLIIIVGAVLYVMSNYIKRGLQGRWKSSIDDLGEQYDPRTANGYHLHTYDTSSNSSVFVVYDQGGYWTNRADNSYTVESKQGEVTVGATCPGGSGC